MSTTGTSLRTIWIEIRALNYSVNVLNDVLRQLTRLQKEQDITAMSCFNMAKAALSAGVLFGILGTQIGGTGGQVLQFASYLMYATAAMQAIIGISKIMDMAILTQTIEINGLAIAYWKLFLPVAAAAGIFFALKDYLGPIPAALLAIAAAAGILAVILWQAAGAMSVLSWGAAAVAGATAIGGAIAASSISHQMGTRQVAQTGPAFLHKGEVVYNPSSGRPTQVGNDLAGGGGSTSIDASMHVENLNTKMDTEQLNEYVRKQQRTIALNNR